MKAYIEQDLVLGVTNASNGLDIPDNLKALPQSQLRFNGNSLIDGDSVTSFYIDGKGIKHITPYEPSWQQLSCNFSDVLTQIDNVWRVTTVDELLIKYKDGVYEIFKTQLYRFVTRTCDFPEWKQVNYLDRYYELNSKANPTTAESTELINLQNVRTWKNNLLTYRDSIKSNIYNAKNTVDVDLAGTNITFINPPFNL